jgi:hypothetical protein
METWVPVLPPELQRQVDAELQPGEKLVWADQPLPEWVGRQAMIPVLFGIPWTAFAVFWVFSAAGGVGKGPKPPIFFPLFGVPFILIGIGMLTSPFWLRRKAGRTVYAVTNQRAIIIEGRVFGGVNVQSFMPDRLTAMIRNQRADGNGDLIFERYQNPFGRNTSTVTRGFMGVRRVREVEDLILATLLSDRPRSAS